MAQAEQQGPRHQLLPWLPARLEPQGGVEEHGQRGRTWGLLGPGPSQLLLPMDSASREPWSWCLL